MANPFDQFDLQPQAAPPSAGNNGAAGNPFDQFDPPGTVPASQRASVGSIFKQIPVGANEAIADTLGAPVDAVNWAGKKLGLPMSSTPFGGSASIKQGMGLIGANPDSHPANNEPERIARAVGVGGASMVLPEAALAGAGRAGLATIAPRATEALQGAFGSAESLPAVAANAASGAVAGGAGQAAEDAVPDRYKPVAGMAASLVGGAGTAAGLHGVGAMADYGVGKAREFAQPIIGKSAPVLDATGAPIQSATGDALMAKPGQLDRAGAALASSATDAPAALDTLETAPRSIVPGSNPTTFQLTGDMGLGGLERTVANSDNANAALFNQRRADQNSARSDAITGLEKNGDINDVPTFLSSQLKAIDQQHDQGVQAAQQAAQTAAGAIGGQGTPEDIGNALRNGLQDARDTAKTRERGLWKAIDPEGSLALDATPIKQAAQAVQQSMPKAAAPMSGEEAGSFAAAQAFPDVQSFNEVTALRSRLNTAMRQEMMANGQSPAYARMAQLRSAVEDAISEAASNKHVQEQAAVQAGILSPEDTMAARLQQEANEFVRGKNTIANSGTGDATGSFGGSSGPSRNNGAIGKAGRGSDAYAGPQDVQGEALSPNFDQAAADRLKAANAATKARAKTFDEGPVGTVLRSRGSAGDYKILDSRVSGLLFKPGPDGFQTAQAYLKAAGSHAEALTNIHDAAALSLRKAAMSTDGTIDPKKLATWQAAHADALRAIPGIAPKFATAGKATETLNSLAEARKAALDDFQSGAVGKLIGASDPITVKRQVGAIFGQRDAVQQMKKLADLTANNPQARQGLRRAIADHIADQYLSNTEAGTSGKTLVKSDGFQTFVRKNQGVLAQVFKPNELASMRAVAADLQRANRSVVAVKNPGGSNTTQDMRSANAHDEHGSGSLGGKLWKAALVAGEVSGPAAKAGVIIGTVGKHVLDSLRSAGLKNVNDLIKEAMLNPDLAQTLLQRASKVPDRGSELTLAHKLARISMFSAGTGATAH